MRRFSIVITITVVWHDLAISISVHQPNGSNICLLLVVIRWFESSPPLNNRSRSSIGRVIDFDDEITSFDAGPISIYSGSYMLSVRIRSGPLNIIMVR